MNQENFIQNISYLVTILSVCLGLLAFIVTIYASRTKKQKLRSFGQDQAKKRYLDYLIARYQYLPVAEFETNLRVPISLERVYVTLQVRMADLDRFRVQIDERLNEFQETQPSRSVNVQEALKFALNRKYDGLVILGNPGSGKTTLLKYFLLLFATERVKRNIGISLNLLPILLFLREVDPQKSIVENILLSLHRQLLELDEGFFLEYLRNGQAILLLDGLDEVVTEEKRQAVSQWIHHQAHLAFPKCPLIVTSRYSGFRSDAVLPGHYLRLEIQDYGLPQVKQFLENWLTAVEAHLYEDNKHWHDQAKDAAEDLYRRIETAPALRDLAMNPLMLQIIALVYRNLRLLPERRVELYRECTDVLLERRDEAKGLAVLLSAAEARRVLQPIALWMHSVENRREISKQELLDFVAPIVSNLRSEIQPEELLKSWLERSGILKGEDDKYFFFHLSFQEYLAAEEIRNMRRVDILVKNFNTAWWREPTLLAVGLTNPPIFEDFMGALLQKGLHNEGDIAFMLRCIKEAVVKSENPFIAILLQSKEFESKYPALRALEHLATEKALAAIKDAQNDQDSRIIETARNILEKMDNSRLIS